MLTFKTYLIEYRIKGDIANKGTQYFGNLRYRNEADMLVLDDRNHMIHFIPKPQLIDKLWDKCRVLKSQWDAKVNDRTRKELGEWAFLGYRGSDFSTLAPEEFKKIMSIDDFEPASDSNPHIVDYIRGSEEAQRQIKTYASYMDQKAEKGGHKPFTKEVMESLLPESNKVSLIVFNYMILDHDAKKIYAEDRSDKDDVRMRAYSGNAEYTLIKADFSIENMAHARKAVASLVKKAPEIMGYTFVDTWHDDEEYPVSEVIKRKSDTKIGKAIQSLESLKTGSGEIIAYHGTSKSIWGKIKKDGRMIPGQGPEYNDKIDGHSQNMIYLTAQIDDARRYAVRAARSSAGVILKMKIRDHSKLRFDEDNLGAAGQKVVDKVGEKEYTAMIKQVFGLEKDPYTLHPKMLWEPNRYGWTIRDQALADKLKRIISYAAIKQGPSFAYEGSIPAKDISVAEESKAQRADKDDPEARDKMRASRKVY